MNLSKRMFFRQPPEKYELKDGHLKRSLRVKDLLSLGIGMIVSTSIFTLPGEVAAMHTGPAVIISFILAAIVAGMVALVYAEMSAAMPFAGSAYTWINVIFGELPGWVVGWALLAEYIIGLSFVISGISSNLKPILASIGIKIPTFLANPLGQKGGILDILAIIIVLIVGSLVSKNLSKVTLVENILVVLKIFAIILFVTVGATAIHLSNFHPFIPAYHATTNGAFGGWQGIYAGVSMIFVSYLGFDAIAANSAEAIEPQKTMPRGIIGSLAIASIFFIAVSSVLIGVLPYQKYAASAEPIGIALRAIHHPLIATIVQLIAVFGMFTAAIGFMLSGSRLIYSFSRDGMLPKMFSKLDCNKQPKNSVILITTIVVIISSVLPFSFLSQLVSAGTIIAFIFVSVGLFFLRKREGKDIPEPAFKVPAYPLLPILSFIFSLLVFIGLDHAAKLYTLIWFILGIVVYFIYGIKHAIRE
ncbi:APC family permease [Ligilactobacillus araffinosus]|nr:amino acid permease [Ligilactobacillus araffinosus]